LCDVGRVAVKHCFKLLSFLNLLEKRSEVDLGLADKEVAYLRIKVYL